MRRNEAGNAAQQLAESDLRAGMVLAIETRFEVDFAFERLATIHF